MSIRGFEIVSTYKNSNINIPSRKTAFSAGYDIESAEAVNILPNTVSLIATGLKACMQPDEYLGIHIRSSIAIKYNLSLINSQGIIDADYYNNENNEGHILIAIRNYSTDPVYIPKGMRIAQGIFYKYLCIDNDNALSKNVRVGGIGSTGS